MRTGTGRRAGSSRSRVLRKPWGSATGSLHDSVPDLGAVEVEALGLGGGTHVEDTLVVAGKDEREAATGRLPVLEQPRRHGGSRVLAVALEKATDDVDVVRTQG